MLDLKVLKDAIAVIETLPKPPPNDEWVTHGKSMTLAKLALVAGAVDAADELAAVLRGIIDRAFGRTEGAGYEVTVVQNGGISVGGRLVVRGTIEICAKPVIAAATAAVTVAAACADVVAAAPTPKPMYNVVATMRWSEVQRARTKLPHTAIARRIGDYALIIRDLTLIDDKCDDEVVWGGDGDVCSDDGPVWCDIVACAMEQGNDVFLNTKKFVGCNAFDVLTRAFKDTQYHVKAIGTKYVHAINRHRTLTSRISRWINDAPRGAGMELGADIELLSAAEYAVGKTPVATKKLELIRALMRDYTNGSGDSSVLRAELKAMSLDPCEFVWPE